MRLILAALLITSVTQAAADCGNLCDRQWWKNATLVDLNKLIEDGKDLRDRDEMGQTPLHWAAMMVLSDKRELASAVSQ